MSALLLRHRGLIAVQAVDHDGLRVVLSTQRAHALGELAGRELGRIDLLDDQLAGCRPSPADRCPSPLARSKSRPSSSSKMNIAAFRRAAERADDERQRQQRLARARRAEDERARAALDAAAEQRVELRDSLGRTVRARSRSRCSAETSRGKTRTPPVSMTKSWISAAVALAAIFDDAQAPALGAIFRRQLLEPDHAMRDAVHGLVIGLGW